MFSFPTTFLAEQNNQHPSVNKPLSLETGELFVPISAIFVAILLGFRLKRRTNFTTLVKRVSCEPEPSPAVINSAIWDLPGPNLRGLFRGVFCEALFFWKVWGKGVGNGWVFSFVSDFLHETHAIYSIVGGLLFVKSWKRDFGQISSMRIQDILRSMRFLRLVKFTNVDHQIAFCIRQKMSQQKKRSLHVFVPCIFLRFFFERMKIREFEKTPALVLSEVEIPTICWWYLPLVLGNVRCCLSLPKDTKGSMTSMKILPVPQWKTTLQTSNKSFHSATYEGKDVHGKTWFLPAIDFLSSFRKICGSWFHKSHQNL